MSEIHKLRAWASSLKWITISLPHIIRRAETPGRVVWRAIRSTSGGSWTLRLKSGVKVHVPSGYPFQCLAETVFLDVYHLANSTANVVVDIGASIGDFTVIAGSRVQTRVFAFERDTRLRGVLHDNVEQNKLQWVEVQSEPATLRTVGKVLEVTPQGSRVFLKLDCEGCEYDILQGLGLSQQHAISELHLEVHRDRPDHSPESLKQLLEVQGFVCTDVHVGGCHYLHARRRPQGSALTG